MEIDLDKYFGHTPGPWNTRSITGIPGAVVGGVLRQYANGTARDQLAMVCAVQEDNGGDVAMFANAYLIADAPALLAEVVRLRADLAEAVAALRRTSAEMTASGWAACDGVHSDIIDALAKHGGAR